MHREDIGKLVARGSKRTGRKLKPNYAVRVETKIYPKGGAVASWNRLAGGSQ